MSIIEQIKAEIERLKKDNEISEDKDYAQYELDVSCGYDMACDDILSFLSTLKLEKPSEELEEEIKRWWDEEYMKNSEGLSILPIVQSIARHFAQWQKEQMIKEFETWLKGNLHHLSCWNADEFCTNLRCYLGMKNE